MRKMAILLAAALPLIFVAPVYAHCPLCSAATGAAVATARFYGVDDLISGTFVGGFIISTGLWVNNAIKKRNKGRGYFSLQLPVILLLSFVSMLVTFYFAGMLHVDKLLAGTAAGSLISLFAFWSHQEFRKIHGKNYMPLQGMFLPLAFLVALNVLFYITGLL